MTRTPLFVAIAVLGCAVAPPPARATTWSVGKCGDIAGKGGDTLRVAIGKAANNDTVDMGSLPLACSTITLTGGQIAVPQQSLVIQGPADRTVTVSAGNASRILFHDGGGYLNLRDFEVAYGNAAGNGGCVYSTGVVGLVRMTASLCHATQAGGAVAAKGFNVLGSLISGSSAGVAGGGIAGFGAAYHSFLSDSTVTANTAPLGGGIYAAGLVTGTYASITNNQANSGGGVFTTGSVDFEHATLDQNVAAAVGGGAYAGTAVVNSSLISSNTAASGGGLAVFGGIEVRSSTLSGNVAGQKGGGLSVKSAAGAAANIYNSTISGNTADAGAGAYLISAGPQIGTGAIELFNSTVAFNTAQSGAGGVWVASPTVVLCSSILANNSPLDFAVSPILAHTTTASANLIMLADEIPAGTLRDDPALSPLGPHGGNLPTHALSADSVAIGHGSNPLSLDFDERGYGYPRTAAATDIGAYERQPDDELLFFGSFD